MYANLTLTFADASLKRRGILVLSLGSALRRNGRGAGWGCNANGEDDDYNECFFLIMGDASIKTQPCMNSCILLWSTVFE